MRLPDIIRREAEIRREIAKQWTFYRGHWMRRAELRAVLMTWQPSYREFVARLQEDVADWRAVLVSYDGRIDVKPYFQLSKVAPVAASFHYAQRFVEPIAPKLMAELPGRVASASEVAMYLEREAHRARRQQRPQDRPPILPDPVEEYVRDVVRSQARARIINLEAEPEPKPSGKEVAVATLGDDNELTRVAMLVEAGDRIKPPFLDSFDEATVAYFREVLAPRQLTARFMNLRELSLVFPRRRDATLLDLRKTVLLVAPADA